jgi:F0F1-type ATP synthase membrane subunit b/b'
MMSVLVEFGVAVVAVGLIWAVVLLVLRFHRAHGRRAAARERAKARSEANRIVAAAEARAAEIVEDAERARQELLARARKDAEGTRRELSTFIHDLLDDVRNAEPERSNAAAG